MAIPEKFIQDLIARTNIAELVGRHVELKKHGSIYKGLCPFHSESSPSFTVTPGRNTFHCFGCGAHGNAIGFLVDHVGLPFLEAVDSLAGEIGLNVQMDSSAKNPKRSEQKILKSSLSGLVEKAAEFYRLQLRESRNAIEYLKGRGINGEIARDYGLGYAPDDWHALAQVFKNYADPQLVASGLVYDNEEQGDKHRRFDRFRNRITFPIRGSDGRIVGFGGRVMKDGEQPKYLNSPESAIYVKGRELYGFYEGRAAIRESGFVMVVEGYMDVLALSICGIKNSVAALGTACTAEQVQLLFKTTESIVFSFDGDAAGERAARRALETVLPFATDTRTVRFLFLPAGHDPDSYVRSEGATSFRGLLENASSLSDFMLTCAEVGCDLDSPEGRSRAANNAQLLWELLPKDGIFRIQMLDLFASQARIDPAHLSALWDAKTAKGFVQNNLRQPSQDLLNYLQRIRPGRFQLCAKQSDDYDLIDLSGEHRLSVNYLPSSVVVRLHRWLGPNKETVERSWDVADATGMLEVSKNIRELK